MEAALNEVRLAAGLQVGEYLLEVRLGTGGMGEVWRARHPMIDTTVAIKILSFEAASRKSQLERFLREARAVNRVQHKNLVKIFSFGELGDSRPYFIMEYLEGDNLREYLRKTGPVPFAMIAHVVEQVARTLVAAHEQGVIHRDLKPENIFLVTEANSIPSVKVLDFGVAKLSDRDPNEKREHPTQTGMALGTPGYMSPEQYEDSKTVDHKADIYSLGVIIYEMICGQHPFESPGETAYVVVAKQLTTEAPKPSSKFTGRHIPNEIDTFLLKALSRRQEDRPQSAQDFLQGFGKALGNLKNEKELPGLNPNEPTQVSASYASIKNKRQSASTPTKPVKLEDVLFSDAKEKTEGTLPSIEIDGSISTQITPAPKPNPLKHKSLYDQDTASGQQEPNDLEEPQPTQRTKPEDIPEKTSRRSLDSTIPEPVGLPESVKQAIHQHRVSEVANAVTAALPIVAINTPAPISLPTTSPNIRGKQVGFMVVVGIAGIAAALLLFLLLFPDPSQTQKTQPTSLSSLPKPEQTKPASKPSPPPLRIDLPPEPPPEPPKPKLEPAANCDEEKEAAKRVNITRDWDLALQILATAQAKCPKDSEIQRLYGYTYEQKGATSFACIRYGKALSLGLRETLAQKTKETMERLGCK